MPRPVGHDLCERALTAGADLVVVIHHGRLDGWRHFNRWQLTRGIGVLFCLEDSDPLGYDWSIVAGRTTLLLSWSEGGRGDLSAALINARPSELTRVLLDGDALAFPQLWSKEKGRWQTFTGSEATVQSLLTKTTRSTSERSSAS